MGNIDIEDLVLGKRLHIDNVYVFGVLGRHEHLAIATSWAKRRMGPGWRGSRGIVLC